MIFAAGSFLVAFFTTWFGTVLVRWRWPQTHFALVVELRDWWRSRGPLLMYSLVMHNAILAVCFILVSFVSRATLTAAVGSLSHLVRMAGGGCKDRPSTRHHWRLKAPAREQLSATKRANGGTARQKKCAMEHVVIREEL
jgi:hypothetical protein